MVGLLDADVGAVTTKVAVTGRSGVGKTALVHHASCSDWVGSFAETLGTCVTRASSSSSTSTSTAAAGDTNAAAAETLSYDFWEVGGRYAAKFPYAVKAQLQGADVIVHVFSFSDRASLQSVAKDVANHKKDGGNGAAPPVVILLGAKRDCVSTCQLSLEEAQSVAAECNLPLVLVDSPPVEPEDMPARRGGGNPAAGALIEALSKARAGVNRNF